MLKKYTKRVQAAIVITIFLFNCLHALWRKTKEDIVRGRLNEGDNTSTSEAIENLLPLTHTDAIYKENVNVGTFIISPSYL